MASSPTELRGQLLHQACFYNNSDLLSDLLLGEEKDNLDSVDSEGKSVVYTAVTHDSFECLEILLVAGGLCETGGYLCQSGLG